MSLLERLGKRVEKIQKGVGKELSKKKKIVKSSAKLKALQRQIHELKLEQLRKKLEEKAEGKEERTVSRHSSFFKEKEKKPSFIGRGGLI